MKKLALALISASALVFGFGVVANAQYTPIPPVVGTVTPGGPVSVRVGCTVGGGNVAFNLPATPSSATVACVAADAAPTGSMLGFMFPAQAPTGTATATLTAPTAPGTYQGTATQGASVQTFTVVVPGQAVTTTVPATTVAPGTPTTVAATTPGSGLPATGSSGIGTTTGIAIGLLVVGAGLFIVAQVRRRQSSPA